MIVELLGNFFSQLKCIPTYLYLPTKYILRKSLKNVYQFRNDLQMFYFLNTCFSDNGYLIKSYHSKKKMHRV